MDYFVGADKAEAHSNDTPLRANYEYKCNIKQLNCKKYSTHCVQTQRNLCIFISKKLLSDKNNAFQFVFTDIALHRV